MTGGSSISNKESWRGSFFGYLLSWLRKEDDLPSDEGAEGDVKHAKDVEKEGKNDEGCTEHGKKKEHEIRRRGNGNGNGKGNREEGRKVEGMQEENTSGLRLTGYDKLDSEEPSPLLQIDEKVANNLFLELKRRREKTGQKSPQTPTRINKNGGYKLNPSLLDQLVDLNESSKRQRRNNKNEASQVSSSSGKMLFLGGTTVVGNPDLQLNSGTDESGPEPSRGAFNAQADTSDRGEDDVINNEGDSLPLVDPDTDQDAYDKDDFDKDTQALKEIPPHSAMLSISPQDPKGDRLEASNPEKDVTREPERVGSASTKSVPKKRKRQSQSPAPVSASKKRVTRSSKPKNTKRDSAIERKEPSPKVSKSKTTFENKPPILHSSQNSAEDNSTPTTKTHKPPENSVNNETSIASIASTPSKAYTGTPGIGNTTGNEEPNTSSLEIKLIDHIKKSMANTPSRIENPNVTGESANDLGPDGINSTFDASLQSPSKRKQGSRFSHIPLDRILNTEAQYSSGIESGAQEKSPTQFPNSVQANGDYKSQSPENARESDASLLSSQSSNDDRTFPRRSLAEIMKEGYRRKQLERRRKQLYSNE